MKKNKIHKLKIDFQIPVSNSLQLSRFVNIFVIEGEKLHFIDTGVSSAFPQIEEFLKKIKRNFSEIQNIFLTHSHPDHIGAAKLIQEKTNCNVYAPKKEKSWIENTELQYKERPVPGFHHLVAGPVNVQQILKEDELIQPEPNITLRVISTPGHSAGSSSFYVKEENALFCGDAVLLPGEIPIFENVKEYLHSLEKIKLIQPKVLHSAWDEPRCSEEIPQLLENSKTYILSIQKTAQQIVRKHSEIQSIDFCKAVLNALNQDENQANPLLLKSFLACLH